MRYTFGMKHESPVDSQKEVSKEAAPTKQPWEVTQKEYLDKNRIAISIGRKDIDLLRLEHYKSIEQALSEGKPVPPEVLAEYPDLAKTKVVDKKE